MINIIEAFLTGFGVLFYLFVVAYCLENFVYEQKNKNGKNINKN
jgi:hypothetical protein